MDFQEGPLRGSPTVTPYNNIYPGNEEEPDEQAAEDLSSRRAEELSLHKAEEDLIRKALEKYGNRKQAAAELGISERTLYRKLSEMGYGKLKETKK